MEKYLAKLNIMDDMLCIAKPHTFLVAFLTAVIRRPYF